MGGQVGFRSTVVTTGGLFHASGLVCLKEAALFCGRFMGKPSDGCVESPAEPLKHAEAKLYSFIHPNKVLINLHS